MKLLIYYHKLGNLSSHELLKLAFQSYLGKEDLPDFTILKQKHGKPYIKEYVNVHFSISHSGKWWVCAFSSSAIGLDLQQIKEKDSFALARRFFHADEIDWLRHRDKREFYRLWAYKESYVKYSGIGLNRGLSFFSVINKENHSLGVPGLFQLDLPFIDTQYFLVATSGENIKNMEVTLQPLF